MTYTAPPLCPTFAPDVPSDRLLTRNLAALSACDLDLARRVAAAHTQVRGPDSRERPVQVRASVSGWPTIAVGEWQLHSAHDPLAEAHGQAQRVPIDAPHVQSLGFGSGALLATLLARPALQRLDVIPLSAGVLHAVAASIDLRPLLCDPRLRIGLPEAPALRPPFVVVPPLLRLCDDELHPVRDQAAAALAIEAQGFSSAADEARWQAALLAHGPGLRDQPGLAALAGRHPGTVALLACGGASLADQVQVLRPVLGVLRRRRPAAVVFIADDSALPPLVAEGLLPDYVLVSGLHPVSSALLRPLPPTVTLVTTPLVPPAVLAACRGPRHLAWLTGVPLLRDAAPEGSALPCRTALPACLALARVLGASAGALLGADLCLSHQGLTHGPKREPRPWQRHVAGIAELGGQVPVSAEQLATLHELTQALTKAPEWPIYNCSPTGARIPGTVEQALPQALQSLGLLEENPS